MDTTILLILVQDGVVNGAIYALLALSLVLVFAVTRVVFIPQGELVAYGALTYAALDAGTLPGSVWLLCALGAGAFAAEAWRMRRRWRTRALLRLAAGTLLLPAVVAGLAMLLAPRRPGVAVEALLALAIVTPMAPYLYRIAFQPMAEASVLTLLIAAVGVHFVLLGLGLVFFGPEGSRALTKFLDDLRREAPILLVEHDMEAVFALADRISVLVYGRIVATGTADDIRNDPEVRRAYLGETA
ncbi:MAG: hypothetical protein ABS99_01915 [Acetobacteraceae bacterium SCN 69-10]|nr:MAG: hypothetical protein ABS99_01915 [Acetobacteraceae bacterium SCN 69-10]